MPFNFIERLQQIYTTYNDNSIEHLKGFHLINETNFHENDNFELPGKALKFIIYVEKFSFDLYQNIGVDYESPKGITPLTYLFHDLDQYLLSEDRIVYVNAIQKTFEKHLEFMNHENPFQFCSSFIFRIKKENKRITTYIQHNIPIEIRDGKLIKLFSSVTEITHLEIEQTYQLSFFNMNKKEEYFFDLINGESLSKSEFSLSTRELEILDLVLKGLSTKQVADQLHISVETVNRHRKNMIKKNNMKNIIQLATEAFKENLL